jgi:hypothetical protein
MSNRCIGAFYMYNTLHHQRNIKDIIMFDRNLFTDTRPTFLERCQDIALAIVLGLALAGGLLHWFDALFY